MKTPLLLISDQIPHPYSLPQVIHHHLGLPSLKQSISFVQLESPRHDVSFS